MCNTVIKLVQFYSLDPDQDQLTKWFYQLNFLDLVTETRIKAAKDFLPIELEIQFQEDNNLPLTGPRLTLIRKLLQSENGIKLEALGLKENAWKDPETCSGELCRLGLARVQDNACLKATKLAFDPRVQFLVGILPEAPNRMEV